MAAQQQGKESKLIAAATLCVPSLLRASPRNECCAASLLFDYVCHDRLQEHRQPQCLQTHDYAHHIHAYTVAGLALAACASAHDKLAARSCCCVCCLLQTPVGVDHLAKEHSAVRLPRARTYLGSQVELQAPPELTGRLQLYATAPGAAVGCSGHSAAAAAAAAAVRQEQEQQQQQARSNQQN
jgi:hypothetical protein